MKRKVWQAKQSPLNPKRWSCDLVCGHRDVWVTAGRYPKTADCISCDAGLASIAVMSNEHLVKEFEDLVAYLHGDREGGVTDQDLTQTRIDMDRAELLKRLKATGA